MKTINKILVAGFAFAATACTGDYLDINSHPYQPGDLSPDNYALTSAFNNVCGSVIQASYNNCQFTDCLLGNAMGGYFADGNAGWDATISNYNAANNWTRVFMESNSDSSVPMLYTNVSAVEGLCENSGQVVPLACAQIVKVAAMSRVTDCYGPIPYTQIGGTGALTTPYDSQETIYRSFFAELDEAIATIKDNIGETMAPTVDRVFGGDNIKWIKFANSLKLRFALRISYVLPDLAKQMAEEAVADGVMTSNADIAAWNYFTGGTNNPFYGVCTDWSDDSTTAGDIVCYMNGYNDPRRPKYFNESSFGGYVGLRRGWATFQANLKGAYSHVNVGANDPLYWMNAAECYFLRAEGAAVFGWNMGGTAEELYNEGIRTSFAQYGVDGAEDYIADDTSVPAKFTDPANLNPWNGQLPELTIKWDESATTEVKQQRIITQKWIANWLLGNESWCDIRRTGYPTLIPVAYNGSGGTVDSNRGAQRMPYPQEEYTNNATNIEFAVTNYLKGADNMGTKLWWACKPGL